MKIETASKNLLLETAGPEAVLRELCLEVAFQGGLSERFRVLWSQQPVVLGGDELTGICRVAAKGIELARGLNGRWYRFH